MNLNKLIKKLPNEIVITSLNKVYRHPHGLQLMIHYKLRDSDDEHIFIITMKDKVRKIVSYFLNDIVKMNLTAKDIEDL